MFKVNNHEGNYNHIYIYNDNAQILYGTNRYYEQQFVLTAPIRNARKMNFSKGDCFELTTKGEIGLFRNGKDLFIHNSFIDVISVEERVSTKFNGETNYKTIYTLKMQDGEIVEAESDYYTRTEKTDDRLLREKIAEIISDCTYNKHISHYEVEKMLEKLNITIKE